MFARNWIVAGTMLGMSSAAFGSDANGITLTHHEPLERVSVQKKGAGYRQKIRAIGPLTLSFDALGRTFEIQLEPNAGLLAAMSERQPGNDVVPYRGQITGSPDSWARIVITNGSPAGLVFDGATLFAIEVPGDSVVDAKSPVAYRLADAIIAPGALGCASGTLRSNGASMFKSLQNGLSAAVARGPGAVSEINVGAVGDFEFTSAMGNNAESAIITRLNNVDGIFSEQLGVQINVPVVETFTDINDPFTDTTDAGDLLFELGSYRQATSAQNNQGLTHLYTGRVLDGSTVGIAFTEALCSTGFGAGLSEGNSGPTFDSLVAAHEIGHNFGAPHDGVPGSACESESSDFLMAAMLNLSDQFSACSIAEMQDDIANADCITPLPSTDISIAFNGPPPTILLGNAATITFDVVNNGTTLAENVAVDITLPGNVSLLAASSSSGACSNGAGAVSCPVGDVAGGSAMTVTVSADTTAVGVGVFDATVTADADDNAGNNQASAQLTVDPAVNLVVNTPASAQVDVDQSTNITAVVENQSALNATGVTLEISLGNGIRAESASWSAGTCTVTAQLIDCQASQLDSQSSSTLSFAVTGLSPGSVLYTVTVAASEADANPANNSVEGTVTVNAGNGGNGGGGGASGLIFLGLLVGITLFFEKTLRRSRYGTIRIETSQVRPDHSRGLRHRHLSPPRACVRREAWPVE